MMQQEASSGILSALPHDCPTRMWTDFRDIQLAANEIIAKLEDQDESGNQFLVVLGLSKYAIDKLLNEEREALGGIEYRFHFEGTVGLIKLIPSVAHNVTTSNFRGEIDWQIRSMGVQPSEYQFGKSTYHPGTVTTKAKEPDECFWPGARGPRRLEWVDWPTLVFEAGVSESLPRLREDARWWFTNSDEKTRIVLLFAIRKQARTILVEKWQLAPPGMYCAQELTLTPTSITGAPLILHFEALMDRPPVGNERDVVLDHQDLQSCTRHL